MKRLVSAIATLLFTVGFWSFSGFTQAQATELNLTSWQSSPILAAVVDRRNPADAKLGEFGRKIDLNNSDMRDFRELRGFYPNLATKIIKNSPYENVEDVLSIPGLSDTQKERLQANLDNFVVTDIADVMNFGDNRINPGVY